MKGCLECGNFSIFLHFSYEIKLIHVEFMHDSCEITAFQTGREGVGVPQIVTVHVQVSDIRIFN
jgi:hypothetical protein